ncbi:hypothetical protein CAOG_009765 [Capsaspora owczarzaki ATCC 30864]|uniref:Uncharacterized protein n=1 Tax=Capsaspora owczarzaki (strain ATCC 30864) TaxID=595528 RepID=A0A0D2X324_CAPO3|nr:hypothetical protein CAOG_009765 [Capsaspora owczarzaki ATCC 30864]
MSDDDLSQLDALTEDTHSSNISDESVVLGLHEHGDGNDVSLFDEHPLEHDDEGEEEDLYGGGGGGGDPFQEQPFQEEGEMEELDHLDTAELEFGATEHPGDSSTAEAGFEFGRENLNVDSMRLLDALNADESQLADDRHALPSEETDATDKATHSQHMQADSAPSEQRQRVVAAGAAETDSRPALQRALEPAAAASRPLLASTATRVSPTRLGGGGGGGGDAYEMAILGGTPARGPAGTSSALPAMTTPQRRVGPTRYMSLDLVRLLSKKQDPRDVISLTLSFPNDPMAGKFDRIEQLDALVNLRVLDLSYNLLARIEGLSRLANLRDLDLSHNNIERIENIESLGQLARLNLEHNNIRAISTSVRSLRNLKVLLLGSNRLENLGDLDVLSPLINLAVLTLSGNPMAVPLHARAYAIFTVRSLDTLDGVQVSSAEREQAAVQFERAALLQAETHAQTLDRERAAVTQKLSVTESKVAQTQAQADALSRKNRELSDEVARLAAERAIEAEKLSKLAAENALRDSLLVKWQLEHSEKEHNELLKAAGPTTPARSTGRAAFAPATAPTRFATMPGFTPRRPTTGQQQGLLQAPATTMPASRWGVTPVQGRTAVDTRHLFEQAFAPRSKDTSVLLDETVETIAAAEPFVLRMTDTPDARRTTTADSHVPNLRSIQINPAMFLCHSNSNSSSGSNHPSNNNDSNNSSLTCSPPSFEVAI